jgi:hypothetical protein
MLMVALFALLAGVTTSATAADCCQPGAACCQSGGCC